MGIIACMPFVFSILVNPNYADAYYQIPLFMIGALLNAVQGLYSVVYIGLKLTKKVAISTVAAAAINILAGVLLINIIGLYAAPIATIISYFIIIAYRYVDLKKYVPIRFDYQRLLVLVVMLGITMLSYYSGNILFKVITLIVVAAISYFLNIKMIRSVLIEIINKIRSRRKE